MFGFLEIRFEAELALDLFIHVFNLFDQGQFVDGLGVVGYRAIAVYGDGHRPHPQHAEGHQAEGEDGGIDHDIVQAVSAGIVGSEH